MRKISFSEDLLRELYEKEGMSATRIADDFGVCRQTISNKLKEFGIPIRNSEYKRLNKVVSRPRLKAVEGYKVRIKYQNVYSRLKAVDQVAEYFGINLKTAYDWKKIHGIQTIKEFSQKSHKERNINKPYANKEWLEKMYSQYSLADIGKMLNCDPSTISVWCRKFGIKTRSVREQWDLKAKFGTRIVKDYGFDLQLYKQTYVLGAGTSLPPTIRDLIINFYGKCECCGYSDVLDIHHIDGNHKNNSPENHGVLCPNCHAKVHRLRIPYEELVPKHISWETLTGTYQEAK